MATKLSTYRKKRDFKKTPEPKGLKKSQGKLPIFVVQKHHARSLHYDFRIEVNGVLKSWAIPKGLPKSTSEKRLAVLTEDHPLDYAKFEGKIPEGEYGAGSVKIWDKGTYVNLKKNRRGKPLTVTGALRKGQLELLLKGKRYKGAYALVHFKGKNWLMIKMKARKYET